MFAQKLLTFSSLCESISNREAIDFAREAGVAYNTVVKIESRENKNPTIETLRSIARALGVSVDKLIK